MNPSEELGNMSENLSDDDILPEARVFDFRAENILELKLQALQQIRNKQLFEEVVEESKKEDDILLRVQEQLKKKPRGRKAKGAKPTEEINDASPPKKARRNRRKKAQSDEETETDKLVEDNKLKSLPAVSRKLLKELKMNSTRHKRRIDLENERILSSCDAAPVEMELLSPEDVESDRSIILKIRYITDISKITVKVVEKFSSIFEKVAALYDLNASEILLCFKDQTIKPTDTSQRLNLKYFDIIDCIPYKPSDDVFENDKNRFLLKMQSNDSRKKIDIYCSKFEKFHIIMKRYSELRSIPIEKLSFEFDGEKIDESETPEDLDMESGSCVDVKVVTDNSISNTRAIPIIDLSVEHIPESEMLQVCVID